MPPPPHPRSPHLDPPPPIRPTWTPPNRPSRSPPPPFAPPCPPSHAPPPPPPPPRGLRPTVSWGGSWRPEPRGHPPRGHQAILWSSQALFQSLAKCCFVQRPVADVLTGRCPSFMIQSSRLPPARGVSGTHRPQSFRPDTPSTPPDHDQHVRRDALEVGVLPPPPPLSRAPSLRPATAPDAKCQLRWHL